MPADPTALARRLLRADRFAAGIGVTLVEVRPGFARARLRLRPGHLNGVGVAQGGAVFTLADFAFAAACNSHGTVAVGLDTSMSFVRGPSSGLLTAEALEESRSRRVSVVNVRVTDAQGDLVAVFRGTAFRKDEAIDALLAARSPKAPRRRPTRRAERAPRPSARGTPPKAPAAASASTVRSRRARRAGR
jgi:acyl-CoA thioesterase